MNYAKKNLIHKATKHSDINRHPGITVDCTNAGRVFVLPLHFFRLWNSMLNHPLLVAPVIPDADYTVDEADSGYCLKVTSLRKSHEDVLVQ